MHENFFGLEDGSFRDEQIQKAMACYEQRRLKESLRIWLEISYVDLNGLSENGWDPSNGNISPRVARSIWDLATECEMSMEELEGFFHGIATRVQKALNLPLPPSPAWISIQAAVSPQLEEIEAQKELRRKEEALNKAQLDWWIEIAEAAIKPSENSRNPPETSAAVPNSSPLLRAKKEQMLMGQPSLFDQLVFDHPKAKRKHLR